ncbi:EF-hand domain-containing protein [uncultured Jannaschia sp.]|uniref:EF-hand domain-containing protein n=1 Tax=uncultured Jannaschia sp. TaxID=293347 RepID=UPI002615323C|nr:EF-hand domain-containing protein [uncultured Jannaschia sp.]
MTKTTTGLCAAILSLAAAGAQAEQHRTDGMMGQPGMMGGMMPGMMMSMMDTDGDGALSREEAQAVHERMFDMVDADGDGTVTMEEMRAMTGGGMMGGASQ